jgi:hypothetical protein
VKSSSLNDLERRAWIAAVVFFHDSALKHGISPEDATQAASWPTWIEDLDDDSPARQLRLGFDTTVHRRKQTSTLRTCQNPARLPRGSRFRVRLRQQTSISHF